MRETFASHQKQREEVPDWIKLTALRTLKYIQKVFATARQRDTTLLTVDEGVHVPFPEHRASPTAAGEAGGAQQ